MSRTSTGKKVALLAGMVVAVVSALGVWQGWPYVRFWYQFKPLGTNDQGCAEYLHRKTAIVFVRVPAGKFLMGSPESEENRRDNETQHEVTLSSFLIGKYEITKEQWTGVMTPELPVTADGLHPETMLSWFHIQEFEARTGFSLPTEAQWEYACRAGTTGPYAGTGDLEEMGWYLRGTIPPQQIGWKRPNGFGIHDMHGNVWEWCEDVYIADFYSRPEASGWNPVASSGSPYLVVRGGGGYYGAAQYRSAFRGRRTPGSQKESVGFRVTVSYP